MTGYIPIEDVAIIELTVDPNVSPGYEATLGSICINSATGSWWRKSGASNTQWTTMSDAKEYCRASLSADKTTNLTVGQTIVWDSFITNMTAGPSGITLNPNKMYEVMWCIRAAYNASTAYIDTQLYDAGVAEGMTLRTYSLTTGTRDSDSLGHHVLNCDTLTLRIAANSGCTRIYANGSWMMVKEL